jgi:hypothetical protein
MDYDELEIARSCKQRAEHPILTTITIDPEAWSTFERLAGDTPDIKIVAHSCLENGLMAIHVACATKEIKEQLEHGWG